MTFALMSNAAHSGRRRVKSEPTKQRSQEDTLQHIHTLFEQYSAISLSAYHKTLNALIVDDHLINRKLIERRLNRAGHLTDVCANGQEAVQFCKNRIFNVVIIDIDMPVLSGLDASRSIKNYKDHIHIVAITANEYFQNTSPHLIENNPFDEIIHKPVNFKALFSFLHSVELCQCVN